eukprot:352766-Chlamydomonas_euryale.AAC.7
MPEGQLPHCHPSLGPKTVSLFSPLAPFPAQSSAPAAQASGLLKQKLVGVCCKSVSTILVATLSFDTLSHFLPSVPVAQASGQLLAVCCEDGYVTVLDTARQLPSSLAGDASAMPCANWQAHAGAIMDVTWAKVGCHACARPWAWHGPRLVAMHVRDPGRSMGQGGCARPWAWHGPRLVAMHARDPGRSVGQGGLPCVCATLGMAWAKVSCHACARPWA